MLLKEKNQKALEKASLLFTNMIYLVHQILNKVLKKYEKHMDAYSLAVK